MCLIALCISKIYALGYISLHYFAVFILAQYIPTRSTMPPSLLASDRHMGFSSVESVGLLLVYLLWRFWRICIATILIIVLLYWMYGGILILLVLLITLVGALYHYQDSLLYYPEQPESARVFVQLPSSVGLPFETVYLHTRDNTQIMTYFIKQPPERFGHACTMIYFHGNAGNIGHRLHNAYSLYHQCQFNILLVEYRGYGKSQGSPSESGLYMRKPSIKSYCYKCMYTCVCALISVWCFCDCPLYEV